MAITTPNMALKCWNLTTDAYNNQDLVDNFARVDQHDHSNGKGVQITGPGIASGQITSAHLAPGALSSLPPNSVGSGQLSAGSVTAPAIATGAVGTTALATGAVTAATIASQAVGTAALAPSSVTSAIIASGAVGLSDLGSDVTGAFGLGLQIGVFRTVSAANGDGYVSTTPTANAGSGAITFSPNGGFCMIGSSLVRAVVPATAQTVTPAALPTTGNFMAIGIDMVAPALWGGNVTLTTSAGTNQASAGNAFANAPALVSGHVRLLDVVLTYNGTSYSVADYRDRRPWARGLTAFLPGTSGSANPGGGTLNSGYPSNFTIPDLSFTGEFTGAPVEVKFHAYVGNGNGGASGVVGIGAIMDGASLSGVSGIANTDQVIASSIPLAASNGQVQTLNHEGFIFSPSAGRHTIAVAIWCSVNNAWVNGNQRGLTVREVVGGSLTSSQR